MEEKLGKLYGIRFEIEFSHLSNTDLAWLFGEVRRESVDLVVSQEYASLEALKWRPLLFEVAQVRTGSSILIDIFPLLVQGASEWIPLLEGVAFVLLKELLERWRGRQQEELEPTRPFGVGRPHIHSIRTRQVSRVRRPDGTIADEVEIETEETMEWR